MISGGFSVLGRMHAMKGITNQDAFLATKISNGYLAVVSDGVGSCQHSDIGSKLLVNITWKLASQIDVAHASIDKFVKDISKCWKEQIEKKRLVVKDCSATAIFALYLEKYDHIWLGRLGDGAVSFLSENGDQILCDSKEDSFINITNSLSSEFLPWELYDIYDTHPQAAFLWSDGISDSSDKEEIRVISRALYQEYKNKTKEIIEEDLKKWITNLSGYDDKTLAYWIK